MSDARLKLLGSRRNTQIDQEALAEFAAGTRDLRGALGVTTAELDALRRQARAQFEVGRTADALAVLRGLFALGSMELSDTLLVALCLEAEDDPEGAALWMGVAERWAAQAADLLESRNGVSS